MVELEVGHRASRAADGFTVHPADDAQQRLGPREERKDISALVRNRWSVNFHKTDIVRARSKTELSQPLRIKLTRWVTFSFRVGSVKKIVAQWDAPVGVALS